MILKIVFATILFLFLLLYFLCNLYDDFVEFFETRLSNKLLKTFGTSLLSSYISGVIKSLKQKIDAPVKRKKTK